MVFIVKVEDEEFSENAIRKAIEEGLEELKPFYGPDLTVMRIS